MPPTPPAPAKPVRKGSKARKIIIFTLIIVGLAGLGTYAWFKKRQPVLTVQTEKAARRNLTELVVANGRIQPVVQVKISPEVSGEIIDLPVKEGQHVHKGDLLLKIKPDFYDASRKSSEASYLGSVASRETTAANLAKAEAEFKRHQELMARKLISDSAFLEVQTAYAVAKSQLETATHQVAMSKAALDKALEDLSKTTIYSPIDGTISRLNSQLGERVVGTAMMAGTEVMTVADLNEMEARIDIGEIDVVLIKVGQKVRLEVEAFRDRKFNGLVTEIANSSRGATATTGTSQEATKFEVRIRVQEKESFRPGMSTTAEIETRYRTNVVSVPIQSVTTRLPKKPEGAKAMTPAAPTPEPTGKPESARKRDEKEKPIEVVFIQTQETAKMVPVKTGISDDTYTEISEGLKEGDEVISGPHKAISRELEDGKKIKIGALKIEGEKKP